MKEYFEDADLSAEGLQTPQGNEATERCPLCGCLNNPGAVDHCEHFVGLKWDGEITWSGTFGQFADAWRDVSNLLEALYDKYEDDRILTRLNELAGASGFDIGLIELADPYSWDPEGAIEELAEFSRGPTTVSDGMPSGSGASLYHSDSRIFERYALQYQELATFLRATLQSDSPDKTNPTLSAD